MNDDRGIRTAPHHTNIRTPKKTRPMYSPYSNKPSTGGWLALGDGLNDANRAALVEASPPDTPSKDPSCAKDFRERWAASLAAVGWKVGLVPGGGATALRAPEKFIVFVGDIRMSGMIECRAVRCAAKVIHSVGCNVVTVRNSLTLHM